MREVLLEIWSSIRKNKLRTFLTGFSVAWGILMLIILLSAGNGLQNGALSFFDYMASNTIRLNSGRTSMPYAGYDKGRRVRLSNSDIEMLKNEFTQVDVITSSGWYSSGKLTYQDKFADAWFGGVTPEYPQIYTLDILEGRFINEQDMIERRKVIVIEESTRKVMFGDESPLGRTVISAGITYTVIGVYKGHKFADVEDCYIPSTTGQLIYSKNDPWVGEIVFTLRDIITDAQMTAFEDAVRRRLAAEHNFDPTDKRAIRLYNSFTEYKQINTVFGGINFFIWIIGLGTLLAGIVGVSNIMLVTVRERTFEFGIRKALGAKPSSIIKLILLESVMITAVFGYAGLIIGAGIMELVSYFVDMAAQANPDQFTMFVNPTVDMGAAIGATIVLIISGLIAGYVPARRAAKLKTIDAMRFNK